MEINSLNSEVEVYTSTDGLVSFDVPLERESVWLTIKQMGKLFDKNRRTVSEHINNIFKENELKEEAVCRKFRHTASDGKTYNSKKYNLDVIISVGYRVKSKRGTQFRQWATSILKEYLLNGYSLNTRKLLELEKRIDSIETHIKDRKPIEDETTVTLVHLMKKLDPNTTILGKPNK